MSRATVTNIETDRSRIDIEVVYALAAALGVNPHSLMPGQGEPQIPVSALKALIEDATRVDL